MEITNNEPVAIPDFPNYYIDKNAHIYHNSRMLKYTINHKLFYVSVIKDGKRKLYRVDWLLAITFIPNPNNYKYILHKDGNGTNIQLENLYWVSKPNKPYRSTPIIAFKCYNECNEYVKTIYNKTIRHTYGLDEYKKIRNAAKHNILYNGYYWQAIKTIDDLCEPLSENVYDIDIYPRLENKIICENIHDILKKLLTPAQYNCIIARYFDGYTFQETAQLYGISKTRVDQLHARALKILSSSSELKTLYTSLISEV